MPSERVSFPNQAGLQLSGILDHPTETPLAFGVFAHCFTCGKDLKAIVKICRQLSKQGIAMLRFDFTGLGNSQGNFSDTNFDTNLTDIQSAVNWLSETHRAPELVMGMSLGGAAIMAAVSQIPTAKALVTLAAPSCTKHLADYLEKTNPAIASEGIGSVTIGVKSYEIKQQLLENFRSTDLQSKIQSLAIPHLILHSPVDQTVGIQHAQNLLAWSGGPKSYVTLDGADHLLVKQRGDTEFVANMVSSWSRRYLGKE